MKLLATLLLAASAVANAAVIMGEAGVVRYDTVYDNPNLSTLSTACSDGLNGLYTRGYRTLGSIPKFPLVGASSTIVGWNSPQCGKCYKIYYRGTGNSIYITGVDLASPANSGSFVLSKAAMDQLTGNLAEQLGRVDVFWAPADQVLCGFVPPTITVTATATAIPTMTVTRTPQ